MSHIQISQVLPGSVLQVYDILTDPLRLPVLLQGKIEVEVVSAPVEMRKDSEVCYQMTRLGFSQRVRYRLTEAARGSHFIYRQTEGLFVQWVHTQTFKELAENKTQVTDIVEYQLPLGLIGLILNDLYLRQDLTAILETRLEKARQILTQAAPLQRAEA